MYIAGKELTNQQMVEKPWRMYQPRMNQESTKTHTKLFFQTWGATSRREGKTLKIQNLEKPCCSISQAVIFRRG